MSKLEDFLEAQENFNLIHYTGHYVLTIDRGIGKPHIFQAETLAELGEQVYDAADDEDKL